MLNYSYSRAGKWLSIYLLLCLVPLGLAMANGMPAYRQFWIEFGVALGFIGLGILAVQCIFTGRLYKIAPSFGVDNIFHFHKRMGLIGFALVIFHPLILILANSEYIDYFNPKVNFLRAIALTSVLTALVLIIITSLWRQTFSLNYEKWRLIHGLLSLMVIFIGLTHSLQVAHYMEPLWKSIILALLMAASMYLVVHTRLVRPFANRKDPYIITEVKPERDSSWTLVLQAPNHQKIKFTSGQFIWITINESPFSLQQHPFSFSSSEDSPLISITAKELGDFTSTWKNIKPGSKAFLEGPFGSFTLTPENKLFLIMGGIGITPAISMLRTLADRRDQREIVLLYASEKYDNIIFREELLRLKTVLSLKLIFILTDPPEDWEGEEGYIDKELIAKYLPDDKQNYTYYICGPNPMMDVAEVSLRDLDVDWRNIYTERFDIV